MNITINGKEVELKYTYNSFKHMGEFNLEDVEKLDINPFKVFSILSVLMLGAVNHNPREKFSDEDVEEALSVKVEEVSPVELLEVLMGLLQESDFFKSLQSVKTPKTKK